MSTDDSINHMDTGSEPIPFESDNDIVIKSEFDAHTCSGTGTANMCCGDDTIHIPSLSHSHTVLEVDGSEEVVWKIENIFVPEEGISQNTAVSDRHFTDILGQALNENLHHGDGIFQLISGEEEMDEDKLSKLEKDLNSNGNASSVTNTWSANGDKESAVNYQPFVRLVRLTEAQIIDGLSRGKNSEQDTSTGMSKKFDPDFPVKVTPPRGLGALKKMDRLGESLEYQPFLRLIRLTLDDIRKYETRRDFQETLGQSSSTSGSSDKTRDHAGSQSTEPGQSRFQCRLCQRTFDKFDSLRRHIADHARDIPCLCNICGETFPGNSLLQIHIRIKHCSTRDFVCYICDKHFEQKSGLSRHMSTHDHQKTFACVICNKRFGESAHVKRHMVTHSNIKPYSCRLCKKRFASERYFDTHMLRHDTETERLFQCRLCRKRFKGKENLRQHRLTHIGEKRFKCEVCNKLFLQGCSLKRHMITHTGLRNYSCTYCGKKFADKGDLTKHIPIHTGEKAFACGLCNKRFARRSHLNSHLMTHTGEKPHGCEICGKRFGHRNTLKGHLRTHTGERPYSCKLCPKTFAHSNTLTCHMVTHTGARLFPCSFCFKKFIQNSHRKIHMVTHTGEKPHRCQICGLGATTKGHLRKHMLVHSGEKPYACDVCGKTFARSCHVKEHKRRVHPGDIQGGFGLKEESEK